MAFPDSIRERIIQEIDAVLADLLIASGFNCNCGANKERGRKSWEESDLPCLSLFPGVESAQRSAYSGDTMVMPIKIDLLDNYSASNPSTIGERMLADVREIMRRARPVLLAGLVEDIQYKGGGIEDYPEQKTKTIGVTASFDITYSTKLGDPYNQ